MKNFLIIASIFLLAFSAQTAVTNSGYEYLPMNDDEKGIIYREAETESWPQSNGELWVMSRVNTGNTIRVTFTDYTMPGCSGIHQHWRYTHLPTIPPNYDGGLVYTQSLAGGKPGMAECRNESGVYMFPGETILTYNPIAGETFTVTTTNYAADFQTIASGTWTYKTLSTNVTSWGPFCSVASPCVWTSLSESTGKQYNFVYSKAAWVTQMIDDPETPEIDPVLTTCWFPGGLVDFWTADPNLGTPTARPGRGYWARPCEI